MEKKSIIIYASIVVIGIAIMAAVVLFLRSRSSPVEQTGLLVSPAAVTAPANQNLPPPVQSAEVRKFQSLEQVPQAKSEGSNVKVYEF